MSDQLKGTLITLIGSVIFGTKAIFVKLAYRYDIDAVSLLMLRMIFALPFFIFFALLAFRTDPHTRTKLSNNKYSLVAMGLLGYYIASLFDLEGLKYIDASLERIILFIYPTLVVIISSIFFKKGVSRWQILAIVFSYLGMAVAFGANLQTNDLNQTLIGGSLVVGSAISYALYIVGSGELATKLGSNLYNSVVMIIACGCILIHNIVANGFNLFDFTWEVYVIGLLLGVVATVIPTYLIVEGIRLIGANQASIIGTIGPISTILLAVMILGESISILQWVGSLIVVGSVLLVTTKKSL